MSHKILSFTLGLLFLFTAMALSPPALYAQSNKAFSQAAPTTTAIRLVASDGTRVSATVQNVGTVNVALGNASTVTYANGIVVAPGQTASFIGDTDAIWGIAQSGTADLRIVSEYAGGGRYPGIPPSITVARTVTLNSLLTTSTDNQTIATTSNTDNYIIAPQAATLSSVDFSGVDALTANDTNYITFSITNLGQAGAGSTAMLAATDANTTKATGGSSIAANTKRSLTLNATAANLVVAQGDRIRVRYAASGTLANTVTFSTSQLRFIWTN